MTLTRQQILDSTIILVRHGSHAYGLATETSDVDLKGICIPPLENYFGLSAPFESFTESQHDGHPNDLVIHGLQKFARLACGANPTILEVLFIDSTNVLRQTTTGIRLRQNKHLFLSKKAYNSFVGYAKGQLDMSSKSNGAALNNAETRAKSWTNLSHTIRLLRTCSELFLTGEFNVYRKHDRDYLLDIKQGHIPLEQIVEEACVLSDLCKVSMACSSLPDYPDDEQINALIVDMTKDWLKHGTR